MYKWITKKKQWKEQESSEDSIQSPILRNNKNIAVAILNKQLILFQIICFPVQLKQRKPLFRYLYILRRRNKVSTFRLLYNFFKNIASTTWSNKIIIVSLSKMPIKIGPIHNFKQTPNTQTAIFVLSERRNACTKWYVNHLKNNL